MVSQQEGGWGRLGSEATVETTCIFREQPRAVQMALCGLAPSHSMTSESSKRIITLWHSNTPKIQLKAFPLSASASSLLCVSVDVSEKHFNGLYSIDMFTSGIWPSPSFLHIPLSLFLLVFLPLSLQWVPILLTPLINMSKTYCKK